jgi:hypothetical protein
MPRCCQTLEPESLRFPEPVFPLESGGACSFYRINVTSRTFVGLILTTLDKCRRGDLNPHGLAPTSTSS